MLEALATKYLYITGHKRVLEIVALPPHGPLTEEKGTADMTKFNRPAPQVMGTGPLRAEKNPSGKTHEGGTGYQRDARSELFLRATCNFAGEDSFYEDATVRDDRLRELVSELAVTDSGWEWVQSFLPWLRGDGNIRSASALLAVEAVRARLAKGMHGEGNRALIRAVLQRADEPGEMLGYWISRYGRTIPKPIKRGVADAVRVLYTERNFLRYDKAGVAVRFGDVLDLVHAAPRVPRADDVTPQGDLFEWAITARHNRDAEPPETLEAVRARRELSRMPLENRHSFMRLVQEGNREAVRTFRLAMAGQWEWGRSWMGG